MNPDAIIVLGRGLQPDGSLTSGPIWRVDRAVELYREHGCPIIFSGKWGYKGEKSYPWSEAYAMAQYAQSLGIPEADCIIEEDSMSTLANAFFTKKIVDAHGWKNIAVVTSTDHEKRSEWLFMRVYGPGYTLRVVSAPTQHTGKDLEESLAREARSLEYSKNTLSDIPDGDDAAFEHFIYTQHPGYVAGITTPKGLA